MDSSTEGRIAACPFVVVTDTREQAPYQFRSLRTDASEGKLPLVIRIARKALTTGDYSIEGMESEIAVERKELSDLFNCCGGDRDRFQKQLDRLSALKTAAVVVEGGWGQIIKGVPHSKLSGKTIFRSVIAWQQRMPTVHWWMMPTRELAEVTTFRILERHFKDRMVAEGVLHGGRRKEMV